jgi:hypothetical protein
MAALARRVGGVVCLLLATILSCWLGYNLFVERLPAAQGLNPLPALMLTASLFYVGWNWIRGKVAD